MLAASSTSVHRVEIETALDTASSPWLTAPNVVQRRGEKRAPLCQQGDETKPQLPPVALGFALKAAPRCSLTHSIYRLPCGVNSPPPPDESQAISLSWSTRQGFMSEGDLIYTHTA